jgi:CheY-like chemotaxis protein/copper chaperone CopZ
MEAIGTLAGGIAHDFNNILATILGNAELAIEDAAANPQRVRESIEEILKAGRRGRDVVQQILSFSRRQPTARQAVNLDTVVAECARLLRASFPARVMLDVHCADAVPAALADVTQIQQVLINLATNAMLAMQGGAGRVEIHLDTVVLDAAIVGSQSQLAALNARHPGRIIRLSVRDNGVGMAPEILAKIFEPFFTTRPAGAGTGLGLSVVHGIVQTHEGAITVESTVGKGTTFTVYLPPDPNAAAALSAPAIQTTPLRDEGAGRHILYLDDEEALVFLVKRLLGRRGYRVSGYSNQSEALAALSAAPDSFDMVVTDYNMPGMSGLDVAQEVRALRPGLPVVIATGFIEEDLPRQASLAGVTEVIFKASEVDALCETFVRVLKAVEAKKAAH